MRLNWNLRLLDGSIWVLSFNITFFLKVIFIKCDVNFFPTYTIATIKKSKPNVPVSAIICKYVLCGCVLHVYFPKLYSSKNATLTFLHEFGYLFWESKFEFSVKHCPYSYVQVRFALFSIFSGGVGCGILWLTSTTILLWLWLCV